jgi:5-methylcytosine-specific restriction endonuclease McrA
MSFEKGRADARHNVNLATIDHIIPIAEGGEDTIENCVAACWRCNNEKSHGDPAGFLFAKSFLRIFANVR